MRRKRRAFRFTEKHARELRFDHDRGAWHRWDGSRWRLDSTRAAFDHARQLTREAAGALPAAARGKVLRASFVSGVERLAQTDRAHAVDSSVWDRDPFLLACPGVTVDLRTGEERAPDPADLITHCTSVAPAEHENCPLWFRFLEDATGADDDLVEFIRRLVGYSLTGDTREHALAFFYGPGGNGKSLFLNTVSGMMGDYAAVAAVDAFTAQHGQRHLSELAVLRGKRLVTASETEEGRAWAEARIKALTGGEPITANFMRRDPFTFRPQFKLVIAGNHRPILRNVDEAARRRFHLIPFDRRPPVIDKQLEAKLRAEWPAILRWAITGTAEWLAAGLCPPETVRSATEDYFASQDVFADWRAQEAEIDHASPLAWETARALYESWKAFCDAAGVPPGSTTRFGEPLRKLGLERGQERVEGKAGVKVWRGIALRRSEGGQ